jgi:hypothetical protein
VAYAICYPITRLPVSRRLRSFVLNWALSLRFLPPIAIVIPYFTIVRFLQIYNQLPALILVYTVFNLPLSIWMLKGFLEEIPLEIEEAPFRDLGDPLRDYLRRLTADGDTIVSVVMPELVVSGWRRLLHNQRALYIKRLLLFEPRVILSSVPYQLR